MTAKEQTNASGSNSADPEQSSADLPPLPHRIVGMVESPGRIPEVITDGVYDRFGVGPDRGG